MKLKYSFMLLALAGVMSANAGEPKTGVSRENLDESVSPCTDFYQYACGGWQKLNPLKPEYSRYGSFDMLGENNKKQLHDLVEGLCGTSHTYGSVEQKIGDFQPLDVHKTGSAQPKLSAACFVVQSCLADVDFVVFTRQIPAHFSFFYFFKFILAYSAQRT